MKQSKSKKVQKKNINKRPPKWLLVSCFTVIAALIVIFFFGHLIGEKILTAPEKVGNVLVVDLQQDNPTASMSLYTGGVSEKNVASVFSGYSPHVQGTASMIEGLKSFNSHPIAVLIYSVKNTTQVTAYIKITLIQIPLNGSAQWRVTGLLASPNKPALDFNIYH